MQRRRTGVEGGSINRIWNAELRFRMQSAQSRALIWITIVLLVAAIFVATAVVTNPKERDHRAAIDSLIIEAIIAGDDYTNGLNESLTSDQISERRNVLRKELAASPLVTATTHTFENYHVSSSMTADGFGLHVATRGAFGKVSVVEKVVAANWPAGKARQ